MTQKRIKFLQTMMKLLVKNSHTFASNEIKIEDIFGSLISTDYDLIVINFFKYEKHLNC